MKWDWLDKRIIECGYTRKKFAEAIDWQTVRLSEMISNTPVNGGKIRNIPYKKLSIFADKLKIEQKSLHEYNDNKRDNVIFLNINQKNKLSSEKKEELIVGIDIIDAEACCGDGVENFSENVIGQQLMTVSALRAFTKTHHDNVKIITAIGDSMYPTINSGDMVWVDISCKTHQSDGLYVINIGGALSIKRLQIHPFTGSISIKSDNPNYDNYTTSNNTDVRIIGKVIYHIRRVG